MSKTININELEVGTEIPPFQVKLEAQKYRKYNRLIKEINPIHFNKKYAQGLGYDTIVVAGNFLFTFLPKWIIDWLGDVKVIKNITIKFENPVYIDDIIIHEGKVVNTKEENGVTIIECEFNIVKTDGMKTSNGIITLSFLK